MKITGYQEKVIQEGTLVYIQDIIAGPTVNSDVFWGKIKKIKRVIADTEALLEPKNGVQNVGELAMSKECTSSESKEYFYYVQWWLNGDEAVPEGLYHSTFVSKEPPAEFLANVPETEFIGEYFLKQFKTKEEMDTYWNRIS